MAFLFITCVALGISQCLTAPPDFNNTLSAKSSPRTGTIEKCANVTALRANQKEILDTCKDVFKLNQTQIRESSDETVILCTLYNHTLISYCRSNNTINYPTVDEIKLKKYTLDSVCKSVVNSSQSIFPKFQTLSCLMICPNLFKEEELKPACLFAHYYYLQTSNVTEKPVVPVPDPQNPPGNNKAAPHEAQPAQPLSNDPQEPVPADSGKVPGVGAPPDTAKAPGVEAVGLPPVNADDQAALHPPINDGVKSQNDNALSQNDNALSQNDNALSQNVIGSEHVEEKPKVEVKNNKEILTKSSTSTTVVKVSQPEQAPPPVVDNVAPAQQNPDDDDEDEGDHGDDGHLEGIDNDYGPDPAGPARPESVRAEPKAVERKPDTTVQEISPVSDDNLDVVDGESPFFSYFMVICVVFVLGYVAYHNRIKVMALLLEGKRNKRQNRGRRPNSANYHKLDSNLEEAISSNVTKNSSNVIY
ncbi:trans-Golgi network integral membrane protein 2 isoform X2 [Diabrotica virgifera virgifera]|nr:trans-Golgi network integral membrane protein 2 isoform X2 [Diabrotica virgifera virgifera]XP_028136551.2 trans-Golgi network integral membrane protein 2 isoform X2 [Diabrotica virgifera virgifera]XP_028136552.2 trans-Golgi network integral membrane protein 2 isoform X2 [Diabrotica virgifera virgifera]